MKEASNSIFAFSGKQIAKEAAITLFFFFPPEAEANMASAKGWVQSSKAVYKMYPLQCRTN